MVLHVLDMLVVANSSQISDSAHILASEVEADIVDLLDSGRLIRLSADTNPLYTTETRYNSMLQVTRNVLKEYHQRYPLRRGMPREELRNRLNLSGNRYDSVIASFSQAGDTTQVGNIIKLPEHAVRFSADQEQEVKRFLGVLREHRYSPPAWNKIDDDLLGALSDRRDVVSAGPDVVFASEVYDEMRDSVIEFCRSNTEISINDVRELLGTSRKYSLALLEQLDRENVTMRVGDTRKLR